MEHLLLVASVQGLVSLVIKELYTAFESLAAKGLQVDQNLMDLYISYKMIEKKMLGRLDCWIIPTISEESRCWHELIRYWYETEDLIDHLILISYPIKEQNGQHSGHLPKRDLRFYRRKITKLRKKLDKLGKQFENLLPAMQCQKSSIPPGYLGTLKDKTPFVGGTTRDKDKRNIIQKLSSHKVGVSIVGMDGLGKTTLARIIKSHFSTVLYASVSGEFLMDNIVDKLVPPPDGIVNRDQKEITLREKQEGPENALIVLDDLSDVTEGEWESFRFSYLASNQGTRVLITTRNPKVAEKTCSYPYYLDQLKDEDCAKIITEKADVSRLQTNVWDEDISDIARKCMGMPLIASKFGLTLLSKTSAVAFQNTISYLKDKELWDLAEFNEILPCFKLNDPVLPSHLMRCFAYCSLFSPKHTFNREELVQLWKLEGLQPSGTECFDDLLQRSIFRPLNLCCEKGLHYRMQGLNYKFAQLLASKVFLRVDEGTTNSSPSPHIRHVSIASDNGDDQLTRQIVGREGLRTFILPDQGNPVNRTIDPTIFHKHTRLRVLDLSHTNTQHCEPSMKQKFINLFPKICQGQSPNNLPFHHLRYLDLTGNILTELPKNISCLRALQVLKIDGCPNLTSLPKDLCKLSSLTHLYVNMKKVGEVPPSLGKLRELEVLSSYRVQNRRGTTVSELGNMEHLRELFIVGLNEISNLGEASKSKLLTKKKLKTLHLEWNCTDDKSVDVEQVLEGLEPNANLEDLTVRFYNGKAFPAWFSSHSKKLMSVKLQDCRYCDVLPSLGKLELLKTLSLQSFQALEKVDRRFCVGGFKRLESLEFKDMCKLESVDLEALNMPDLQSLTISSCPNLQKLPSLKHLVKLVNVLIESAPILEFLPELPSSMNGQKAKLTVRNCSVVEDRCRPGEPDWEKIKDIKNRFIS